jgi:hypothetical protein
VIAGDDKKRLLGITGFRSIMKKGLFLLFTLIPALGFIVWPMGFLLTVMMFDNPQLSYLTDPRCLAPLGLAVSIWSYPSMVMKGTKFSYQAYRTEDYPLFARGAAWAWGGAIFVGSMHVICFS